MAPKPKARPANVGADGNRSKGSGKGKDSKGQGRGGAVAPTPSSSVMAGLAEVKRMITAAGKKFSAAVDATAKCQSLLASGQMLPLPALSGTASKFRVTFDADGKLLNYEEYQHATVYKTGQGVWNKMSVPSAGFYDPSLVRIDAMKAVEDLKSTAEKSITGDVRKYPRVVSWSEGVESPIVGHPGRWTRMAF